MEPAVKAISLWEPWATLMRTGAKTIATRSWATSYRGPLLICAATRRHVGEMAQLLTEPAWRRAFGIADATTMRGRLAALEEQLHYDQAVAIVDLRSCRLCYPGIVDELKAHGEEDFGDYSPGRYAWITTNLRAIKPFPVRGSQGLFEVELPPEVRMSW